MLRSTSTTQLPARDLQLVSEACTARRIPLLVVQSYGMMGYLRLAIHEHQVVESHPDHAFPDLRVLAPPEALTHFVAERYPDLSALSSTV